MMRGMESDSFDLVYLDPPFNSKRQWSAPIGSAAAGAAFKDTWTLSDVDELEVEHMERRHPRLAKLINAVGDINGDADKSYLIMMAPRLLEMHRLLKSTGSIYLHCDPVMSHSVKLMMDSIFGVRNFRNEILWCYPPLGRAPKKNFPRKSDTILFYAKSNEASFNHQYTPSAEIERMFTQDDGNGRKYRTLGGRGKYYLDEWKGVPIPNWWADIPAAGHMKKTERTGYPTQKPRALLERIIRASCPSGGWLLDPFCGCATACVAAENLNSQWVGIDLSPKAAELVVQRFENELGLFTGSDYQPTHRTDMPKRKRDIVRTPKEKLKKWLYGEQAGNCAGCDEHFAIRHFEIDHIVPRNRGGHDGDENKQLLCGNCNRVKGDKSQAYLESRRATLETH